MHVMTPDYFVDSILLLPIPAIPSHMSCLSVCSWRAFTRKTYAIPTKQFGLGFTVIIVILWPILSLPPGVFSEGYFSFWVALSIIWGIVSTLFVVFLPLWESRDSIVQVFSGVCGGGSAVSEKTLAPSVQ